MKEEEILHQLTLVNSNLEDLIKICNKIYNNQGNWVG